MEQTDLYQGVIIAESLEDPEVIKEFTVLSEEYAPRPKWHLFTVAGTQKMIEALASQLKEGSWYTHFWSKDNVIVIFRNKIFRLIHSDRATWQPALQHGASLGIPPEQLDFPVS